MKQTDPDSRRSRSNKQRPPLLVAITGGSGSGKSWLAKRLRAFLAPDAVSLSLDDFYRDRSHLAMARRAWLNFDRPGAVDWPMVEHTLKALQRGRAVEVPCYDFTTHTRLPGAKRLEPKPVVLVEGLWLLRRPSVRSSFGLRLFVDCPRALRLRRRLARDVLSRGRTRSSVLEQFRLRVQPMHERYVGPQTRYAHLLVPGDCGRGEIRKLATLIRRLATSSIHRDKTAPANPARAGWRLQAQVLTLPRHPANPRRVAPTVRGLASARRP